ncbi:hypothetical protein TrST_g4624 [Triparma strigata]|uniref:Potassium channel domain-containing protein n=1 Tax=Triparma strigata TaxID=1606541 RepID=A0A9W7F031_9STRA|nr:hypothetical protein TrST_g4624 [Triparma strigata]
MIPSVLKTILFFASCYYYLHNHLPSSPPHFNFTDDLFDPLYFSVTVSSTVGFGDLGPQTRLSKCVVMLQMCTTVFNVFNCIKGILSPQEEQGGGKGKKGKGKSQ